MNTRGAIPIIVWIVVSALAVGVLVQSGVVSDLTAATVQTTPSCPSGINYCSSLTPESRYVCNDGRTIKYACPAGQICSAGACVSKEQTAPTCPTDKTSPYCSSVDSKAYFQCNPSTGQTEKFKCATNSVCSDGKCVLSSVDKNSVTTPTCPVGTTTPYCSTVDTTAVFQCNQYTGLVNKYRCSGNSLCQDGQCVAQCPHGLDVPYCSDLTPNNYYKCDSQGVVTKYTCRTGFTCNAGDQCFHEGIFPSGDTIGDVSKEVGTSVAQTAAETLAATAKAGAEGFAAGLFGEQFKWIGIVLLILLAVVLIILLIPYLISLWTYLRSLLGAIFRI